MKTYANPAIFRDDLQAVGAGIIHLGGISKPNGISQQSGIASQEGVSAPNGIASAPNFSIFGGGSFLGGIGNFVSPTAPQPASWLNAVDYKLMGDTYEWTNP